MCVMAKLQRSLGAARILSDEMLLQRMRRRQNQCIVHWQTYHLQANWQTIERTVGRTAV